MDITGKIVTLIAVKLKLLSQRENLIRVAQPACYQECPEY